MIDSSAPTLVLVVVMSVGMMSWLWLPVKKERHFHPDGIMLHVGYSQKDQMVHK